MIGRLSGKLAYRAGDHVMIDVGGVGYLVYCSERTLAGLPQQGSFVSLYTDLLVREDVLQLFGFQTLSEKEWYRLLTTVQGVGAKAALAMLGTLGADGVGRAIALGDSAAVRSAPGIGPKIALRVINELKDKAPAVMAMAEPAVGAPSSDATMPETPETDESVIDALPPEVTASATHAQADALSALSNLGYAPGDAASAVTRAIGDAPEASTEEVIRAALRLLAPRD